MRSHAVGHLLLGSSLVLGIAVAACGGGESTGPGAQVPTGPSAAPTAVAAPTASATAPAGTAAVPPPAAGGPMKTPTGSAMAEDLKKLGIDPLHAPALSKLSPDVVRKLMPTFAKSLGVKCEACHDVNNFKASTPNKKVAAQMWQHFVVDLALESGEPLYCDSCHGGKKEFLDTHDKKALSAWMDANYVSKLKRADKKAHSCETCHGDPFEPKFLKAWETGK
ncbi:MAG TPA: cytochrome c3 family protein [Labilithrix sp.]|nr:cytochrome c3 family protein [Labilithrix sp.]